MDNNSGYSNHDIAFSLDGADSTPVEEKAMSGCCVALIGSDMNGLRRKAATKAKRDGYPTTEIRTRWNKLQLVDYLNMPVSVNPYQVSIPASLPTSSTESKVHSLDLEEVSQAATAPAPDVFRLEFSTFARKTDSTTKPIILVDKQAFIDLLSKHDVRPDKDGTLFAPASFAKTRKKENFISATGACFDFDHGQAGIESVLELLPGTLAAYYSTHSHTSEDPHFRVVTPLSRPVNADEHDRLVLGIMSTIPPELLECLDKTCFEKTRIHYLPSCPPEHVAHAFTGHQDGKPLDVEHFLNLGDAAAAPRTKPIEHRPTTTPASADTQSPAPLPTVSSTYEFIDTTTGEMHNNLAKWAAQNPDFDLVAAIDPSHYRGKPKEDAKQHIACPFEDQHTDQSKDLATFAANASSPDHPSFTIYCQHAHCAGRDRLDYIKAMLEKGWMTVEQLHPTAPAAIEMKRPPKVNIPVNDILTDPAWASLLPDERRVALDLALMCWSEIDGMIIDNDWAIARRLGMSIEEWQPYRVNLKLASWLIISGGRLTNSIVKREFDKAQDAYMKGIAKSKKGGEVTQKRARLKQLEAGA